MILLLKKIIIRGDRLDTNDNHFSQPVQSHCPIKKNDTQPYKEKETPKVEKGDARRDPTFVAGLEPS